jgi:hypothetical protein
MGSTLLVPNVVAKTGLGLAILMETARAFATSVSELVGMDSQLFNGSRAVRSFVLFRKQPAFWEWKQVLVLLQIVASNGQEAIPKHEQRYLCGCDILLMASASTLALPTECALVCIGEIGPSLPCLDTTHPLT